MQPSPGAHTAAESLANYPTSPRIGRNFLLSPLRRARAIFHLVFVLSKLTIASLMTELSDMRNLAWSPPTPESGLKSPQNILRYSHSCSQPDIPARPLPFPLATRLDQQRAMGRSEFEEG